jgi:hypothetical protein
MYTISPRSTCKFSPLDRVLPFLRLHLGGCLKRARGTQRFHPAGTQEFFENRIDIICLLQLLVFLPGVIETLLALGFRLLESSMDAVTM